MKLISTLLLCICLLAGCNRFQEAASDKTSECSFQPPQGLSYKEEDLCLYRLVEQRCVEGDQCLLDCWANKDGENVGGGCWHICFAYTGRELTGLPDGAESCQKDESES